MVLSEAMPQLCPSEAKFETERLSGRFATIIAACLLTGTTAANLAAQGKSVDPTPSLPAPASRSVEFGKDIQPIFTSRCIQCHSSKNLMGGLTT